jgi:hypothetical protein
MNLSDDISRISQQPDQNGWQNICSHSSSAASLNFPLLQFDMKNYETAFSDISTSQGLLI